MGMSPPTNNSLEVPCARLHCEVQGSGPGRMLVGHPIGCSGFVAIAPLLAEGYTVATYDPRCVAQPAIRIAWCGRARRLGTGEADGARHMGARLKLRATLLGWR
jgi:hypothetical protein